jgi:hypothetical protein
MREASSRIASTLSGAGAPKQHDLEVSAGGQGDLPELTQMFFGVLARAAADVGVNSAQMRLCPF